jgi:predicted GIY-YIG superfamily endonuclease
LELVNHPQMAQMLLIPDPRPLVERLGLEFFRQAPQCPGVYLMRDAAETVLYVGKARNLRQRLSSYRVANPDRLRRRHLRLLRAIARIELQPCPDESSALAREAELLRALRPRFNRIGTWPGPPRFLAWRVTDAGLDLVVTTSVESGWLFHGPFRASASGLHAALFRLLWCAVHPGQGVLGMPQGSFDGWVGRTATIPHPGEGLGVCDDSAARLRSLLDGQVDEFDLWIRERTSGQSHPFELSVREADLETVRDFALKIAFPKTHKAA